MICIDALPGTVETRNKAADMIHVLVQVIYEKILYIYQIEKFTHHTQKREVASGATIEINTKP